MKTKLLPAFLLLLFWTSAHAQSSISNQLDGLMKEAVSKDLFSGNVLILQDSKVFYQKSAGMADYEKKIPNTPETAFGIGSITKLFTKIMVLQLAAEGKIALDDQLGKHLAGFEPEIGGRVTILQLLNHEAGFGQYYDLPGFMESGFAPSSATDFLPWIQKEKLLFEPGARSEYSNSGYVLLGAILEKLEGKNYGEALKTRILDKTGMNTTGFSASLKPLPGKAVGYLSNQPGPRRDNFDTPLHGGGDGGIYSTVDDLARLDRSLAGDQRLLSDADKLRLMNDPLFPRQYASWAEFSKEARFAVAGGAPGINAVYGFNREKNMTVIVLSNYDEGSAEALVQRISAILNGKPVKPLRLPEAKFIYELLSKKGAAYFTENIERELMENEYLLDDDMVLLFAGQTILAEGKAEEAIALYRYYTESFPWIVVAWNDLGDAYLLANDKENAKKCFQKALELRPGNVRAKESLGKL